MINLFEKFANLNRNIVDSQYPIVFNGAIKGYYGVSKEGFLRLAFLSSKSLNISGSTKNIDVVEGSSSENSYWTCFDLKNDELLPVFSTFGEDLVHCIDGEKSETIASNNLRIRYKTWLALFKRNKNSLSPEKTQGLFGELYFLKNYMIPKHGSETAIASWSGPDKTSKDFSVDSFWYELKTVGNSTAVVKISSLQQLSSDVNGNLVIIRVEGMSDAFEGKDCSINKIIRELLSTIDSSDTKDQLLDKVSNYGYDFCDDAGDKKFHVSSINNYLVDNDFPVLKEEDLKSNAINNVSYELIISLLKNYMTEE